MSVTREQAIQVLWRRGELSWKLHDGQRIIEKKFQEVKGSLCVLLCSRRFGKTYWQAVKALETALRNPDQRVFVATAFQKDMTEIILPIFRGILGDCPDDLMPTWLESKKKFVFDNGSEIVLLGLDKNPDGGRGRAADLYVIDEAGFVSADLTYLYQSVILPMQMNRPGARVLMISTPSVTVDHKFYSFYEKARLEDSQVSLNVYQNPMLTPEEIEKYKSETLDESTWRREYLCEWVRDESSVVIPEWRTAHVQPVILPSYPVHFYQGMDIGTRDKTFYFNAYYDFAQRKLFVINESSIAGKDMVTSEIHSRIEKADELIGQSKPEFYRRVSDNSHPLLLNDLAVLFGVSFIPVKKKSLVEMVNRLREFVKAGRLVVDPRCKELILNLESQLWNKQKSQFERSSTIGHADGLAALIYCVLMIDENTNPVPITYGMKTDGLWVPPQEKSDSSRQLQKIFSRR